MRRVMGQLTGPRSMAGCAMASELSRTSSTKLRGYASSRVVGRIQQTAARAPCHIEGVDANVLVPHKNQGVRGDNVGVQKLFGKPPLALRFCGHL